MPRQPPPCPSQQHQQFTPRTPGLSKPPPAPLLQVARGPGRTDLRANEPRRYQLARAGRQIYVAERLTERAECDPGRGRGCPPTEPRSHALLPSCPGHAGHTTMSTMLHTLVTAVAGTPRPPGFRGSRITQRGGDQGVACRALSLSAQRAQRVSRPARPAKHATRKSTAPIPTLQRDTKPGPGEGPEKGGPPSYCQWRREEVSGDDPSPWLGRMQNLCSTCLRHAPYGSCCVIRRDLRVCAASVGDGRPIFRVRSP